MTVCNETFNVPCCSCVPHARQSGNEVAWPSQRTPSRRARRTQLLDAWMCMLEDLWRWRMHRCAERDTPCGQRTRKLVASVHWWIPMQPRSLFPSPTASRTLTPKHLGQPRAVSIALNTKVNVGLQGHLHSQILAQVRAGLARSLCDRVYHVCLLDEKPRKILGELSKR